MITQSANAKKQFKKFAPKISVLAVMMAMLSACQSTNGIQASTPKASVQPVLSFEESVATAKNAKASLLTAMERHLSAERYIVSSYQTKIAPLHDKNSPDAAADTLWGSVIKTNAYKEYHDTQAKNEQIYRSHDQYLAMMADDLPHLRLYDELNGTTPANPISHADASGEQYADMTRQAIQQGEELRSCLTDVSIKLDDLVEGNPQIDTQDGKVLAQFAQIDDCIKQSDEQIAKLLPSMQGYAKSDLQAVRQCANAYRQDVRSALSKNRQQKSFSGDFYDYYDLAWIVYARCANAISQGYELEPERYLGVSQRTVLKNLFEHRCMLNGTQAFANLREQGKDFANHISDFMAVQRDSEQCEQDGWYQLLEKKELSPLIEQGTIAQMSQHNSELREEFASQEREEEQLGWFDAYKKMKQQSHTQQSNTPSNAQPTASLPPQIGVYANMVMSALDHAKKTPEQTLAKNLYQHDRSMVYVLSHHQPDKKRLQQLVIFEQASPTSKVQISLPVRTDFMQSKFSVDTSAILPILALSPQHALLPQEVPEGIMHFGLPKKLQGVIATERIYTAVNRAILLGLQNTNDELFTPVDASQDAYAKSLKAGRVIKLNLDMREYGRFLAMIGKEVASELKQHLDHQDLTDQPEKLAEYKRLIDDWALINQGHHTADVGGLFAMIDGILPIKMYDSLYYYLDKDGKLLGMTQIQSASDHMSHTKTTIVGRSQYGKQAFDQHAFAGQFTNAFTQMEQQHFDGNAWLKDAIEQNRLQTLAQKHRTTDEQIDTLLQLLQSLEQGQNQAEQDGQDLPETSSPINHNQADR